MEFLIIGLVVMMILGKNNTYKPLETEKKSYIDQLLFIPSPNFYPKTDRKVDKIIIHITQGSFKSALQWFKMKQSQVSAHFLIGREGQAVQMVALKDVAWHARPWNTRSIGIEHEGFYKYQRKTTEFTEEQYLTSARIVKELCERFQIPMDREHIIGHREVPDVKKTCPGYNWNWDYYMNLLRSL